MSRFDKYKTKADMAEGEFFFENRELFGHFDLNEVKAGLIAYLKLNYANDLAAAAKNPTQLRQMFGVAFVTLLDRGTLVPLSELNAEAADGLAELRKKTGIGVETLPAPPPPALTAAELLREQVLNDWRNLPAAKVRAKANGNRTYSQMLNELANSGALESSVTALTRAGA